ncbi:MAG: hypothetical protein WCY93_04640 [Anaerolineaceae bacterium]
MSEQDNMTIDERRKYLHKMWSCYQGSTFHSSDARGLIEWLVKLQHKSRESLFEG